MSQPEPPPFPPDWLYFGSDRLPRPGPEFGTVEIALPCTKDTGTFARYVPFDDKREVIVRRGTAAGFNYGMERGHRRVSLDGREYEIVTYMAILSPPVHVPGRPLLNDPEDSYHPEYDVLYVPGTEVMMQRRPASGGFNDAEGEQILKAIRLSRP